MPVPKSAASCWRRAAEAETQAAQISDRHLKDVYLRIADQWSVLGRCYEFADSAERFLLDAKRTKDADAQQPSKELVLLPVVAGASDGSSNLSAGLGPPRSMRAAKLQSPQRRYRSAQYIGFRTD
jgi:hypothetical protein